MWLNKNKFVYSSDAQLVASVMAGNEAAIHYMFFDHYRPLLHHNYVKAASHKSIEFDDLLQELYLYLSEKDWERLRRYDSRQSFVNWFSVVSYRFFKDFSRSMIDSSSELPIYNMNDRSISMIGTTKVNSIMMDIKRAISELTPPRDRDILEALLLRDEEPEKVALRHSVTVENLYNIKRRALAKLIKNHLSDYQS